MKILNLNHLLQDLNRTLCQIIGKDIELITLLSENLGRIGINPDEIKQLLMSVAFHAKKAMPGGGKLILEAANIEFNEICDRTPIGVIPGHYVMLSINAKGCGVSPEWKNHLFEPVFETTEPNRGTGMGLSVVYDRVKQSGGVIWMDSQPDLGTTLKIFLLRLEEEVNTLPCLGSTGVLPQGKRTVLVVEDEPSVRKITAHILLNHGYTVLEASNGEEALRIVHEHKGGKIHLLLTDVLMPQMGGRELVERLKAIRPDMKVLYTSGYPDNTVFHQERMDHKIAFLQKPFSLSALTSKVREVLES